MTLRVHKHAAARRRYRNRPRSGPVTTTQVPAELMTEARRLASQGQRIVVVDAGTVLVVNVPPLES